MDRDWTGEDKRKQSRGDGPPLEETRKSRRKPKGPDWQEDSISVYQGGGVRSGPGREWAARRKGKNLRLQTGWEKKSNDGQKEIGKEP